MRRVTWLFLLLLFLLAGVSLVLAVGGEFSLPWFSVDGGGGRSQGGDLVLSGAIGQPEAGGPAAGGPFRLQGGYWSGPGGVEERYTYLYLPLLQRS